MVKETSLIGIVITVWISSLASKVDSRLATGQTGGQIWKWMWRIVGKGLVIRLLSLILPLDWFVHNGIWISQFH